MHHRIRYRYSISPDTAGLKPRGHCGRLGYPGAVATALNKGATLSMCEADPPKQYKVNVQV